MRQPLYTLSAQHILTEVELEAYGARTGPITVGEKYRNRDVTARCCRCDRSQLRRHLVSTRWGVRCIDEKACRRRDAVTAAELADATAAESARREMTRAEHWAEIRTYAAAAPAAPRAVWVASGEVVNRCPCGRAHTLAEWDALPSTGRKEVRDGGVEYVEDYRRCGCGSTRMIARSARVAGTIYYLGGKP